MPSASLRQIRRNNRRLLIATGAVSVAIAIVAPTVALACAPSGQAITVCDTSTGLWNTTWTFKGDQKYPNEKFVVVSQSRPTTPMLVGQTVQGDQSISVTENGLPSGQANLDLMVKRVSTGKVSQLTLTAESTGSCSKAPTNDTPSKPVQPSQPVQPNQPPPVVTTPVAPMLSLVKHRLGPEKRHGRDVPFSLKVTNTGLVAAKHVVITDLVPNPFFVLKGKPVTRISSIAPGKSVTVKLTLRAIDQHPNGCWRNHARVVFNGVATKVFVTISDTSERFCLTNKEETPKPNNPGVTG